MNVKAISVTGEVMENGDLVLHGPIHYLKGKVRVLIKLEEPDEPASEAWTALEKAWGAQRANYFLTVANGELRGAALVETEQWEGKRNTRGLSWEAADLRDYMSETSEKCYCAGWLTTLEFDLWDCVMNGPVHRGNWDITQSHIDRLRFLARRCGGWIVWDDGAKDAAWVPIEEWLIRYERHRAIKK